MAADLALLTLGGALKRKEMLSARLGDILSELYLLSAALKRWEDEGRQPADLPLLEWCMRTGFETIGKRFAAIFKNFPNRFAAALLRWIVQPLGAGQRGPADNLSQRCADLLLEPSAARDRLTAGLFLPDDDNGFARLERAFTLVTDAEPIAMKLKRAHLHDPDEARRQNILTGAEAVQLAAGRDAVAKVVDVDDFAPEKLRPAAA